MVAAPSPAPRPTSGHALAFLKALGKVPAQTYFRTLPVGLNHSRHGADLLGFDPEALARDNTSQSVYFVTGNAIGATGISKRTGKPTGCVTDADCPASTVFFVEWDGKYQPIEWQEQAWQELGLPEPSAMVRTGGKSVHCYWVLRQPLSRAEWEPIQRQLIAHCRGDESCKNISRVMRVPGFAYIDKATGRPNGNHAELIHNSEARYSLQALVQCIPAAEPSQAPAPLLQAPRPAPMVSGVVVPFRKFITKAAAELIETGSRGGSCNGDGLKLSNELVAVEAWLQAQGAQADETARDAYACYLSHCDDTINDAPFDTRAAWVRFEGAVDRRPTLSTPEEKLLQRLSYHCRDAAGPASIVLPISSARSVAAAFKDEGDGELLTAAGGFQAGQQATADPLEQMKAVRALAKGMQAEVEMDPVEQVEALRVRLKEIQALPDPAARTLCRCRLHKELGLSEKGFAQLLLDLIEDGTSRGPATFDDLMAVEPVKPLAEDLFPQGGLVLLAGEGGSGKSSLAYRLAESVMVGGKFAGQHQCAQGGVVIVQKDESSTDARAKFRRMAFKPPPGLIHFRWSFTPSMLPELERQIVENGVRLVVMDSLLSIAGGQGAKATDAEFALFIYELNQLASNLGVTILMIHHLTKGRGRTEVTREDVYGSSYIVNAASSVWGFWKATGETSQPGEARLRCLKDRSGIAEAGTTYDMLGSLEDYSWLHMGIQGSTTSLDQIHGSRAKTLHLLKTASAKFTKEEVSQATGCSEDTAKRLLTELFEARCGVNREPIPTPRRGRPSYRYWWVGV